MTSVINEIFSHACRVYWEDTDGGGIVYYANYLKFAERARTEWLRSKGFDQSALLAVHGIAFVVRSANIKYKSPAQLDDLLDVSVEIRHISPRKIQLAQNITRQGRLCASLEIELVTLDKQGRLYALPDVIHDAITK